MSWRNVLSTAGLGASSISFWWRRCTEQSRSHRCMTRPCVSPMSWISMWRGRARYFSMYTSSEPNAASASCFASENAWGNASPSCATRMPFPPPPAAALMITGKPIFSAIFNPASASSTGPGEPGAGDLRGRDDARDVEVAVAGGRAPNAHVVVGETGVQAVPVRLGVDGDRLDGQLLACTDHPQGDLPAVRDQHLLEHQGVMSPRSPAAAVVPPNAWLSPESTPETFSANSLGFVA